jgi:type IV pilus assembly protein PilW
MTSHHNKVRGMTLVELIIAMALGMIILAAMASLFASNQKARAELDKSNRLIENGRYALVTLVENVRLAGFYGTLDPRSATIPAALSDPCSVATFGSALRHHVQGYAAPNSSTAPDLSATTCGTLLTGAHAPKPGSDILVVRRVETSFVTQASIGANASNTTYLQPSLCQFEQDTFADTLRISATAADLNRRGRNCTKTSTTPYANAWPISVHIYFVAQHNKAGDGIPTLKRVELHLDPVTGKRNSTLEVVALAEGIEYLKFEYGIDDGDSNGDGAQDVDKNGDGVFDGLDDGLSDRFVSCSPSCTVDNWAHVIDVKAHLLARNLDPTAGHDESLAKSKYVLGSFEISTSTLSAADKQFKRHVFSQFIRLVNPAGRRES